MTGAEMTGAEMTGAEMTGAEMTGGMGARPKSVLQGLTSATPPVMKHSLHRLMNRIDRRGPPVNVNADRSSGERISQTVCRLWSEWPGEV
ncbi:MAG: hypothetical protein ACF8TS_07910 [Maioricimonas sp. JB049]